MGSQPTHYESLDEFFSIFAVSWLRGVISMKAKRTAGIALLLSVVMLGAFISGCIDQGNTTGTTSPSETGTLTETSSKTGTSTATRTETTTRTSPTETQTTTQTTTETPDVTEKKILELVEEYEKAISDAKAQLEKAGFEIKAGELSNWDAMAKELKKKAENEKDPQQRTAMLYDLARLRYYELLNLRSAVGISAVEKAYWANATTGEPIEAFYNIRGDFFYAGDREITKMDVKAMVEKMYSITKGYELEGIEIYQVGTGSILARRIREGGRTVGAGLAAIKVHAKDGMTIRTNGSDFGVLRLVDPNTGETVMKVTPDEKGTYTVPPVNTTLLGMADGGGFCYRPLPLDENYMELMPITDELTLDEVLCAGGLQIAPFVFDPTDGGTGPYDPAPMEDLYLMPGEYTVQTFAMKADLKQLAEQLVNINVRMGGTKVQTKRATKALDAFQNAVTSGEASMNTPVETTCSCTVSPLLNEVFKETFGGEPFDEVPVPESINITDFGAGPFIPIPAEGLKDYSAKVRVFVISDSKGNANILIDESGISEGERLAPSYLNRVFIEVITGRNPQTGKEARIAAAKVLNTDGTIAVRDTLPLKASSVRLTVLPSGGGEKLSNAEQASER